MTAWTRFVAFLDRPETGTTLALFRMAVGALVVASLLAVPWAGAYEALWYDAADGGWRTYRGATWLFRLLGGHAAWKVDLLFGAGVVSGTLLALGVGGPVLARVVAFVTLQAFQGLADLNAHAGGSYDMVLCNSLWILVLAGPTRTLSVDCWRRTGAWTSADPIALWPRFLIVFQAVLMYTTTGIQKVSVHWVPGGDLAALYYIQQQPTWQLHDMQWVAWVFPLTQLATAATWWWEVTAPLWLWAWVASLDPTAGGRFRRALARWRV
ncbi:MAG: HTTM domain-containing protein, partial [Myxococcales bacterium]|nr:HTTM domain-containing protein [Myxococcales bacterium]